MAEQTESGLITLSNLDIQKIIPHRFPFLLVDKIIEMEWGKRQWA